LAPRRFPASTLVALLAVVSAARAGIPLEAFGRLPSIEDVALSPDGSMLAFVRTTEDSRLFSVVGVDRGTYLGALRVGDAKLRSLQWADNEHVLLTTASSRMPWGFMGERLEWSGMQVYDLKTHKTKALLQNVGGILGASGPQTMNVVYGRPLVQGDGAETIVYLHGIYVEHKTLPALFSVNLTSGAEKLIKRGGDSTVQWFLNDSGKIVAEEDYVESARRWEIRLFRDGHLAQTLTGIAPVDYPSLLGLTADGEAIVAAVTDPERVTLKSLLLKDGTWGPDISPTQVVTRVIQRDGSQRILGTGAEGDRATYHFIDPLTQDNWDWVVRVFRGDRVELVSMSADDSRILVRVLGPKSGYSYHLADVKEHITQLIGSIYEGVTQIAEVQRISYTAADGLHIPAYLTLPPGRPAKNLPIIVMPHGGPQARDHLGFDWWAQALAAQGYAVLQPNFRGSSLGEKWVETGFGEWGRKMQTDVSDGLRYLASQGIADPKRACIVGGSYGGYAALAGVTIESGIYRCAVSVAGISDVASMLRYVERKEYGGAETGLRSLGRFVGTSDPGDKRIDEISPLRHIDQLSVPVMLIHGRDDTTVPYDQSADMAKALKRAGKPVEFVALDQEDHYLSRSATRLQMLKASVAFLQKHNPAD
jgi:dipeptidyl aminopeptidase/acylaminoacyl peptidase